MSVQLDLLPLGYTSMRAAHDSLTTLELCAGVRGCFWHQHQGCIDSHIPKTRPDDWQPKLQGNQRRGRENKRQLRKLGWRVYVVWECQTANLPKLANRLARLLGA